MTASERVSLSFDHVWVVTMVTEPLPWMEAEEFDVSARVTPPLSKVSGEPLVSTVVEVMPVESGMSKVSPLS